MSVWTLNGQTENNNHEFICLPDMLLNGTCTRPDQQLLMSWSSSKVASVDISEAWLVDNSSWLVASYCTFCKEIIRSLFMFDITRRKRSGMLIKIFCSECVGLNIWICKGRCCSFCTFMNVLNIAYIMGGGLFQVNW